MNPWMIAGGAMLGAVKDQEDKKNYQQDASLAATTNRFSPWTKMHANMPGKHPSTMGSMMQGAMTGASMGQGMGGGEEEAVADAGGGADGGKQQLLDEQDTVTSNGMKRNRIGADKMSIA